MWLLLCICRFIENHPSIHFFYSHFLSTDWWLGQGRSVNQYERFENNETCFCTLLCKWTFKTLCGGQFLSRHVSAVGWGRRGVGVSAQATSGKRQRQDLWRAFAWVRRGDPPSPGGDWQELPQVSHSTLEREKKKNRIKRIRYGFIVGLAHMIQPALQRFGHALLNIYRREDDEVGAIRQEAKLEDQRGGLWTWR